MLSTMTKFDHLRFALDFTLKNKEGGRAVHPSGFLLIQLLLFLMVNANKAADRATANEANAKEAATNEATV